jgi:hypothetical protein
VDDCKVRQQLVQFEYPQLIMFRTGLCEIVLHHDRVGRKSGKENSSRPMEPQKSEGRRTRSFYYFHRARGCRL